ncbi:MAG: hypothetical protein LLG97_05680 [Deltaproteobacteria bacterium]|nr:hypothetical protein [Deltaproteobacteria bacterium]
MEIFWGTLLSQRSAGKDDCLSVKREWFDRLTMTDAKPQPLMSLPKGRVGK